MATNLDTLIAAIRTAEDGQVISKDYHNSLRDALKAIADQLNATPFGEEVTASYPPHFMLNGAGPNWQVNNGIATRDAGGLSDGWFALHLPQGARIQSLNVKGRRVAAALSFTVKLLRVALADPDGGNIAVVTVNLKNASDPFNVTQIPAATGLGPKELEELRRVDNSAYTYLIVATVRGSADNNLIQINGIQVSYTVS
jgi:hypothetical protein